MASSRKNNGTEHLTHAFDFASSKTFRTVLARSAMMTGLYKNALIPIFEAVSAEILLYAHVFRQT